MAVSTLEERKAAARQLLELAKQGPPTTAQMVFCVNFGYGVFEAEGRTMEYNNLVIVGNQGEVRDGFRGVTLHIPKNPLEQSRNKIKLTPGLRQYILDQDFQFPGMYLADVRTNVSTGRNDFVMLWAVDPRTGDVKIPVLPGNNDKPKVEKPAQAAA